ncbi:hypothetical protein NM208_g3566 [Fusarium decemcellulare]|uniref:Uncharacterized protein n=1 Tax=Fusarium decemcellulare TaxID=57161 RepID=A0ACC1SNZ8_9HYPO|nr:hypothetical protein NM208_g3566 [Fusarium decemcellulare]
MTTDPDAASPRKLSQLEELLQLKKIEPDVFQSVESLWHPPGGRGLYGGVVISQSLTAAQRTVEDDFVCNSIKSQFLLPGTDKAPVTYSVARLREGRSYVTRMVRAVQEGRYISVTMISFARKLSREHQHVRHAAIMARVEEPHTEERHNGCDVANDTYAPELSPVTLGESSFPPQDRVLRCWIRAPEQISQADDLTVHQAVLAFLSDWIAISVIPYVHGYFQFPEAILKSVKTSVLQGTDIGMLSTLSHSIYFHSSASIRADDWMLIEIHSPWAGNERCLAAAKMFATDGTMLATYFQEIDIPTLTWAVHRLNGVCAPVNSAFTSWELAQQLQKSSVKVLFTVLPLLEVAKEAAKQCGIPEHRIYVCEMHGVDHPTRNRDLLTIGDILAKGKTAPELEELQWAPGRSQQQVAFLSHSSGTSGAPKVAMITHANLIANILQMTLYEQKGRGGSSRRETVLGVLPHSHIYGVVMISHLSTFRGDSVIVLPKFDMSLMLASVARYQISTLNIVPPIILAMSKNPDLLRRYDLSSVKSIFCNLFGIGHEPRRSRDPRPLSPIKAAFLATLAIPFYRMAKLQPHLPRPSLKPQKAISLDEDEADDVRRYTGEVHYYMPLSMHPYALGPVLWSIFWQPDIQCNLVSPWLAAITSVIRPAFNYCDFEMLAKIFTLRRPRVALWWHGLFLLGNPKILDFIRNYLTNLDEGCTYDTLSRPDIVTAAWTGAPQSYQDDLSSTAYYDLDDDVPRAALLQHRHTLTLRDPWPLFYGWRPFGFVPKDTIEPDLYPWLERGHDREYRHWTWWSKNDASFEPYLYAGYRKETGRFIPNVPDNLALLPAPDSFAPLPPAAVVPIDFEPSRRATLQMINHSLGNIIGERSVSTAVIPDLEQSHPWLKDWTPV